MTYTCNSLKPCFTCTDVKIKYKVYDKCNEKIKCKYRIKNKEVK